MKLVFCSDPLNPRQPDEAYQAEVAAAERLDIPFALVDHEALVHENDNVVDCFRHGELRKAGEGRR